MTPPTSADAPLGKLLTMNESQLEKNIAHGETLKTAPSVAIEDLARGETISTLPPAEPAQERP